MCKKMFSLALDDLSEAAIAAIAQKYGLNRSAIVRRCIAFALSEVQATIDDLQKAVFYLCREIDKRREQQAQPKPF